MLKKVLASALLVSALALSACSSSSSNTDSSSAEQTQWEKVQEAGVLKVATPGTLFPTSDQNDNQELGGYEIDRINEIGKRLDLEIEYEEIGLAEGFTAVDSGKVDIYVNNFDVLEARKEKYNFSIPHLFRGFSYIFIIMKIAVIWEKF